jgi:hypothetical protein
MSRLTWLGKGNQWLLPFCLSVSFTVAIQTLGLSEFLPVPLALLAAAGWGVAIGLIAIRIRNKVTLSAWLEDALVVLGAVAMAFFAFGGLAGVLLLSSALKSSSLSGETLVLMFLPSIPLAIMANAPVELLVVPVLLILGWRAGTRRILIVAAAALYFVHRVWTYLVFASDRLDFAETEKSTTPLTAAERQQFYTDLHLDDPRWILNLAIFAFFLLAAHFSRVRELKAASVSAGSQRPLQIVDDEIRTIGDILTRPLLRGTRAGLSPRAPPSRVEPRLRLRRQARPPAPPCCRRARTVHLSG